MRQISAADVSPQWPILEPLDGCRERPIALSKPVCVAGDRARVNLTLRDATVSRAHAIFVTDERGAYFRDLASLNHVLVNDEPVREALLQSGDVVKIGPYAFRCQGGLPKTTGPAQAASTAPAAELRTPDETIHVPLNSQRTTLLGSRDDCDVKMAGDNVSPAHAVIFEMHDRRYIRDLRSISGTFINGKKTGQAELHPDDEIQIGESKLIYASAPAHDPDGTLAGILAEDEAPAHAEKEPEVAAAEAAAPSDDLETIPLIDENELQSLAQEFAEEKDTKSPDAAPAPGESKSSDSSIIPLLDDSEFAPGLATESHVDPTIAAADSSIIPLAEDSAAPVQEKPAPAKAPRGRKRDASDSRASKRKHSPRPSDSRTPGLETSRA